MAPTTMPFLELLLMKQNNNKSETKAAQTPPATAPTTMSILELLLLLGPTPAKELPPDGEVLRLSLPMLA